MRAPVPLGTRVRVTNLGNGRVVTVTINDRGPFIAGRIIDLTPAGAHALGFSSLARVRVESL
jgi:rare lipoprotein A